MKYVRLINDSCENALSQVEDNSVQLIYLDPPYGTSHIHWDVPLDWEKLWPELWRVLKPSGVILIHSMMPQTAHIISQHPEDFKYTWVWNRGTHSCFLNSKYQPLRVCEDICIFYKAPAIYNPQTVVGNRTVKAGPSSSKYYHQSYTTGETRHYTCRQPKNILDFKSERGKLKPYALIDFLIRTYTNMGDMVLDPCMHTGNVGIRCSTLGRRFTGIEKDSFIFKEAEERLAESRGRSFSAPCCRSSCQTAFSLVP